MAIHINEHITIDKSSSGITVVMRRDGEVIWESEACDVVPILLYTIAEQGIELDKSMEHVESCVHDLRVMEEIKGN
jgi:hypothetical protein